MRDRPADIRPLAKHFLAQLSEIHRKPHPSIASRAMTALERYAFPGNVRELRNLIERAVVHGTTPEIVLENFPVQVRDNATGETHQRSLEEVERLHISEVLDYTRGKKTRAAKILGISRKTLLEKRKRYGLD
jgi:DNA-binding NtrC family response regulator